MIVVLSTDDYGTQTQSFIGCMEIANEFAWFLKNNGFDVFVGVLEGDFERDQEEEERSQALLHRFSLYQKAKAKSLH